MSTLAVTATARRNCVGRTLRPWGIESLPNCLGDSVPSRPFQDYVNGDSPLSPGLQVKEGQGLVHGREQLGRWMDGCHLMKRIAGNEPRTADTIRTTRGREWQCG
jgi:hypothetical protein